MRLLFLLLLAALLAPNVTAELPNWISLADKARWAANAHNVQSWRLLPVSGRPDQKRLVLHPDRLLPETDPYHRQLTISLGAFLAVLEDAAAAAGAQVTWVPLDDRPGALLTLSAAPPAPTGLDALSAPTAKYRTTALAFDAATRASDEARSTSAVRVRWLTGADAEAAKVWAQKSFDLEMDLPRTRDESIRFTRYGEAARKATPWGITLVPNFTKGDLFWIETLAGWFPQTPEAYAQSAKELVAKALAPVTQLVVITSRENGVREQLATGVVLERLWLAVRSRGGELLPLSQGLQEFPEMKTLYGQAHENWAEPGETVQMVLALFRPAPGDFLPSPRIAAADLVGEN